MPTGMGEFSHGNRRLQIFHNLSKKNRLLRLLSCCKHIPDFEMQIALSFKEFTSSVFIRFPSFLPYIVYVLCFHQNKGRQLF